MEQQLPRQDIETLRAKLRQGNRQAVVQAATLEPSELQQLFDELVWISLSHGLALCARGLIAALPREWVLARLEEAAEPYLSEGTDDEWRRIMELCAVLDQDMTLRLARRAAEHADAHIREAGEEFLAWGPEVFLAWQSWHRSRWDQWGT